MPWSFSLTLLLLRIAPIIIITIKAPNDATPKIKNFDFKKDKFLPPDLEALVDADI